MATLGEGYMQICISVSRDLNYKTTDQLNVDGDLARANPGKNNPGGHAHDIPEVLLADQVAAVGNPLSGLRVVDVAHDRERPCEKNFSQAHDCEGGVTYRSSAAQSIR